ncbi:FG-GAP repeat domain-containing protein [Streptomyces sp. NPDC127084]|uniref:FG-GAP repeat domain-containing protein n=1 Tax=Streptomyces sp. NPDC127084 TaxID=3347133 RepID=UPI003652C7B5
MTLRARTSLGLALTPALFLALAAPSAIAAPSATTPGLAPATTPGLAPAATAGTASGTTLGRWGTAKELSGLGEVMDMRSAKDGTIVALVRQATADGRRMATSVRPAGSTSWLPAVPTTASAISVIGDGSVVTHWTEQTADGTAKVLRFARLVPGATGFSAAETIATVPAAGSVTLAGNASGRLAAAWMDDDRRLTVSERPAPGSPWSAPAVLDQLPGPVERPDNDYVYRLYDLRLAVANDGSAMVIWGGNTRYEGDGVDHDPTAWKWHYKVLERAAGATSWAQPADLPQLGEQPEGVVLSAHPKGGFHWFSSGKYAVKAAGATAWSPVESVGVSSRTRSRPQMLALPNGDLMVISVAPSSSYYGASGTPGYSVRSAVTGKWAAVQRFPSSNAVVGDMEGSLRATLAGNGSVVVTWGQNRFSDGEYAGTDVKTSTYAAGSWSAPKVIGTGIDRYGPTTEVATDSQGRPVALWSTQTYVDGKYAYRTFTSTTGSRALPKWRDYDDDGRPDILGVATGSNTIRTISGDATGLAYVHRADWTQTPEVLPFGDLDGDRCNDVLVRLGSGEVRMYTPVCGGLPSEGTAYRKISSDWKYDSVVSTGDLTGDGRPDLLARSSASGYLYLYPNNGNGAFASRVKVGSGWNTYKKLIGTGDLNGDGKADILALDKSGELWRYEGTGIGNGVGTFERRALVFKDWGGSYTDVVGAGDLNGDGKADVVSRDTSGRAWLNAGKGTGGLANRTQIGSTAVLKSYRPS